MSASSALTCALTAAVVTPSSLAAAVKLRWVATASNTRRAFSGRRSVGVGHRQVQIKYRLTIRFAMPDCKGCPAALSRESEKTKGLGYAVCHARESPVPDPRLRGPAAVARLADVQPAPARRVPAVPRGRRRGAGVVCHPLPGRLYVLRFAVPHAHALADVRVAGAQAAPPRAAPTPAHSSSTSRAASSR